MDTEINVLSEEMNERITLLANELDHLNSVDDVLNGNWMQIKNDHVLTSRLYYTKGQFQLALNGLRTVAKNFADRKGMSVENLVDRYHLKDLKTML